MKVFTLCSAAMFFLVSPSLGRAQSTGRIECPRNDGYVYLYSSITTMEVRATLQCGDIIQITGRYDNNYSVRTAKGDTGFVPVASVVLFKDQPGTGPPAPASAPPTRERTPYDERPRVAPGPARENASAFTLLNDTPVHVKLMKAISSATSHVGDAVEFEVIEDVLVDGVPVLTKGSKASGAIAGAEPKKHFGRGGRIAFSIRTVRLAEGEQATVRCYQEVSGSSNTSSADAVVPLASGKDAVISADTKFTALVDGDVPLKRESFATPKDASTVPPDSPAQAPKPQH